MDPSYNNPLGGPNGVPENSGKIPVNFVGSQPIQPAQPVQPQPQPQPQPIAPVMPAAPASQMDDIILAKSPRRKFTEAINWRHLVIIGVFLLLLIIVAVVTLSNSNHSANGAKAKDFFDENAECISKLETRAVRAANGNESIAFYFSVSDFDTISECVSQLSAAKNRLAELGTWSNDKISGDEFNKLKRDLTKFITAEENRFPVYEKFFDAYTKESTGFVQEYLSPEGTIELTEDGEELTILSDRELYLKLAAERLEAYLVSKNLIKDTIELNGCVIDWEYDSDNTCAYYINDYNGIISGFVSNTTVAELIASAFKSDYDTGNSARLYPRILLITNTDEDGNEED